MKKIVLTLAAGLSALSTSYVLADELYDGIFLGAQTSFLQSSYSYSATNLPAGVTTSDPSASMLRYGVYGGYGSQFSDRNVYLGFRAGFEAGSNGNKTVGSGNGTEYTASQGSTVNLDLLPGFLVNDQQGMIYLVAGLSRSTFQLKTPGQNFQDSSMGWRAGLGYAFALTDHFYMDLEFVHTGYGSLDFNGSGSQTFSLDPNSNGVTVGIQYGFNGPADSPFLPD